MENGQFIDDFPLLKPPFIGDFPLPCLITRGYNILIHVVLWFSRMPTRCQHFAVSSKAGAEWPRGASLFREFPGSGRPTFPTIGSITGWWFGTCFIFPFFVGDNHPNWLSYFSDGLKPPTRSGSGKCPIFFQVLVGDHIPNIWMMFNEDIYQPLSMLQLQQVRWSSLELPPKQRGICQLGVAVSCRA